MPDAAAGLDGDYGYNAPSRRKPARATSRKKGRKAAGSLRQGFLGRMPRYAAIAISATIGVGIVVNALMMQHGHHPAPLFGSDALVTPAAAKAAVAKAEIADTDASTGTSMQQLGRAQPTMPAAPVTQAVIAPAVRTAAAREARRDDPIARLIGGAQLAAPLHKPKATTEKVVSGKHRKSED